jgi:hypothetical protein
LTALTELGTCSMAPLRSAIPARIAGSLTVDASVSPVHSPSASSVLVDTPSRTVAK